MRTTITLDDDVSAKLKAEMRKSGRSFKQVVNDFLREGMNGSTRPKRARKFKVTGARPLGLRPGFSYDNIGELLEQAEGPWHK